MAIKALLPLALLSSTAFAQLNTLAKAKGLEYFGTATDNSELTDPAYKAILTNSSEFGQITPANSMKWDATESSQNTFTFTNGDVIANLTTTDDQKLRCHNLVWYEQLPSWGMFFSFARKMPHLKLCHLKSWLIIGSIS
jgi:endo-1,4-beta-xylanase